MPQMSPLMWGLLFLIFSGLLVLSMTKLFFVYYKAPSHSEMNLASTSNPNLNWKW